HLRMAQPPNGSRGADGQAAPGMQLAEDRSVGRLHGGVGRVVPAPEELGLDGFALGDDGGRVDRIDQRALPLSDGFSWSSSGTGVTAYVIDTGIDAKHSDLNVVEHVNFAGGRNTDCNGHGTHVAGTVAARDNTSDVVGVAPGAPLTGVKVLGCSGSGSWSGVIKGIDWVTANAKSPAVANMSLGGGANNAVDEAVRNSANSGILSTRKGGGTTTMSGTSMASPHTAGGGALYLSSHSGSAPGTVEAALKSAATATNTLSKDGRPITRLHVGGF
ncbi:MAG: S8 family serine peptidase, partial [Actinobacteria bacterium]|nr:S8 family serine peptidase [Actinomycetota bacterium]